MHLQSVKSVKHNAANSVNRSILKKSGHIGFGVFIVHSSMVTTNGADLFTSCLKILYRVAAINPEFYKYL
jgi:hypothetical protein